MSLAGWILDFDGSLVELAPHPDQITLPGDRWEILVALMRQQPVWICTGRAIEDLARHLDRAAEVSRSSGFSSGGNWREHLGVIGSHGLEWQFPLSAWQAQFPDLEFRGLQPKGIRVSEAWWAWREAAERALLPLLEAGELWIEEKKVSWTLHPRDRTLGFSARAESVLHALEDPRVALLEGKCVVNFVERGHSKGRAVSELILNRAQGLQTLTVIGDEETDETVFRLGRLERPETLAPRLHGIKVGEGVTAAQERVPNVDAVWERLKSRI